MVTTGMQNRMLTDLASRVMKCLESEKYVASGVDLILKSGVDIQASDILMEPERGTSYRIRYRVNGRFHTLVSLPEIHADRVKSRLKVLANIPVYVQGTAQDGRLEVVAAERTVEIRMSVIPVVKGERAVLRLLDPERTFRSLDQLGFKENICTGLAALLKRDQGLIIICGSTSSGKTTTLYALLDRISREQGETRQVILVEDPVEFPLPDIAQVQVNENSGFGFEAALRAVLRQDPEVIGLGEIRDSITARMAIRSALTGHLVLGTLHAGSPEEVPARLRELGADRRLVAGAITGILAQKLNLVACSCGDTAAEITPDPSCKSCLGTGISGRKAEGKLVEPDADFRNMVLNRAEMRGEL